LVVQQFDANARAPGPARVVLDSVHVDISNFSMALGDTRLRSPGGRLACLPHGAW
jgi:hypothetical protein